MTSTGASRILIRYTLGGSYRDELVGNELGHAWGASRVSRAVWAGLDGEWKLLIRMSQAWWIIIPAQS